ncbi:hypothetical protein [Elizabethkingia anophelis]|uniref:hypothetical protein n=1 Tax=Elizabethkingia anophelis TaxID=1117645 RepID=UPI00301C607C
MIRELYPLLKRIETRPAMWTGEFSLQSINTFVSGYYHALLENGLLEMGKEEPFFDWIANKLGYSSSTAGWVNMIVACTIGFKPQNINWNTFLETTITKEQHVASVEMFYKLLDEFKNQ